MSRDNPKDKLQKLTIGSISDVQLTVEAQFNPRELQLDRAIAWGKHANVGEEIGQQMEFTGQEGRTLTLELLFDASEYENPAEIVEKIGNLEKLAVSSQPFGTAEVKRRPHHCVVTWAVLASKKEGTYFKCVITGLSVKYTMFNRSGEPLRAVATLKLQEAETVSMMTDAKVPAPSRTAGGGAAPAGSGAAAGGAPAGGAAAPSIVAGTEARSVPGST